VKSTDYNG